MARLRDGLFRQSDERQENIGAQSTWHRLTGPPFSLKKDGRFGGALILTSAIAHSQRYGLPACYPPFK